MRKTMIVARHNEDVSWLSLLIGDWDIIVYDKSDVKLNQADYSHSITVEERPNEGRESETYLTHIIERYDAHRGIIAFVQGNPFDHLGDQAEELFWKQLERDDLTEWSCIGLGHFLECDPHGRPHHWSLLPVREMAETVGIDLGDTVPFVAGAQYIVGAKVLTQHSAWLYQTLRRKLLEHVDWGYCLERLWSRLFSPVRTAIVYLTHHSAENPKVPEKIRRAVIEQIDSFRPSRSEVIAMAPSAALDWQGGWENGNDKWFPMTAPALTGDNMLDIYKSLKVALQNIHPGTLIHIAEHDVLYPATYWIEARRQYRPGKLGYNDNLFFLTAIGAWTYRSITLLSCVTADRDVMLKQVEAHLAFVADHKRHPDALDLGVAAELPGPVYTYRTIAPVLDIRFEQQGMVNTTPTGTQDTGHHFYDDLPYWGSTISLARLLDLHPIPKLRELSRRAMPSTDPQYWLHNKDEHQP